MANSTWDKSLETGNALIDSQHRAVIKLNDELKEVESKSHDEVLDMLEKVMEFTLDHFLSEENLMMEVDYPPSAVMVMVENHKEFKSYVRLRVLEFRRAGDVANVLPLQSFMDHFLKEHEFGIDRQLADWIRRRAKER